MPELPEVETTRRGIAPHLVGHTLTGMALRQRQLRWPVPGELPDLIRGVQLEAVDRRGKYLLFRFATGCLLIHLGMSGNLRLLPVNTPAGPHDHVDLVFDERVLRYQDPRRFGALLWAGDTPFEHPLLRNLGPEPLSEAFNSEYLATRASDRRTAIKNLIMDAGVVVGVGNIYANESLHAAGVHPARAAGRISRQRLERLCEAIKQILKEAIAAGGTTLRDFQRADGRPGYFRQQLRVYGRGGAPCPDCGRTLREIRLGQRSTVYCPACQR